MSAKQKVTLYIPDELHRQFKIRSAVDGETMSSIAQRAIKFYLGHADIVENAAQGQTHRIHNCPKCSASVALRDDGLVLIQNQTAQQFEDLIGLGRIVELSPDACSPDDCSPDDCSPDDFDSEACSPDEGELITC
jgi:hypothetical protein